jgi:hypothetical protein
MHPPVRAHGLCFLHDYIISFLHVMLLSQAKTAHIHQSSPSLIIIIIYHCRLVLFQPFLSFPLSDFSRMYVPGSVSSSSSAAS